MKKQRLIIIVAGIVLGIGIGITGCNSQASVPTVTDSSEEEIKKEKPSISDQISEQKKEGTDEIKNTEEDKFFDQNTDADESIDMKVFQYRMEYILPDSANHVYSKSELEDLTKNQLRLARNEIYARHGRIFKDVDINDYFIDKEWYNGTLEADKFDECVLNQVELKNLELIKTMEEEKGERLVRLGQAPYIEEFNRFEKSHNGRKVNEKLDSDGAGMVSTDDSRVIVHENYYEVTHCRVWGDEVYSRDIFEGKKKGDTVWFEGEEAVISDMTIGEGGLRNIEIVFAKLEGQWAELTSNRYAPKKALKENKEGFYSSEENDIYEPTSLVYIGSVYFDKNSVINVGLGDRAGQISAEKYFEKTVEDQSQENEVFEDGHGYGRAGGLMKDGKVRILGGFLYDEKGYITEYTETSRNWVG